MDIFANPIPYDDEAKRHIYISAQEYYFSKNNEYKSYQLFEFTNCSDVEEVKNIE